VASGATLKIATTGDVGEALNISGTGVSSAGAVHFTAGAKVTGTVTLSADSTVQVADSITTAEISGKISGSAGVTKGGTGAGTLILSGDNDYTGATTIDVGTLSVGRTDGSVPDRSAVTLSGTATFNLANNSETVGSIAASATGTTITLGSGTLSSGDDKTSGGDQRAYFHGQHPGARPAAHSVARRLPIARYRAG
jgi:autotransporter-associated beta strand protein